MRVSSLLQKLFANSRTKLDKRLHRLILETAETLSRYKQLSIFGLGRSLSRKAHVKHNIKTIDRLFGNPRLVTKGIAYYKDCVHWLVRNTKRPIVIIDWSGLTRCGEFHFLRASVPVGGRALPILDMAFHLKDYMTQSSHKLFLEKLNAILPSDCKPIIVTDAGFRCPWFKLVRTMNWDFIGRVRNLTQYQNNASLKWTAIKTLYNKATTQAAHLFKSYLAKGNPVLCNFYIVKNKKKNRIKKNLIGKKVQCSSSKKHERSANEPWLLVSSLNTETYSAKAITNIYKKRMQIEEGFRDLKNTKNGFSLRHSRSYSVDRLNVALLLSAIAMLLLWVIGLTAKTKGMHFRYQANTVKTHNVLSNFIIGWQVVMRDIKKIKLKDALAHAEALAIGEALIC